ncbi:unnamed protein product [Somion occarium]|uniref:Alkyl transferase n=1 Tax=Somion occarium TaxID=3059160 RepID=A0ABP1DFC3_9APHY
MMSDFISRSLGWVSAKAQDILLRILASGPVPKHVGFIMDGNRRYARMHQQEVKAGHAEGYVALRRVLEICMRLNICCVSVYGFSIENFKRSPQEVEDLLSLVQEKLLEICQYGDLLDEHGIRLNVIGNKTLFPPRLQAASRKAEEMTRKNNRAILNLCMPYTSRDEIFTAIQETIQEKLDSDSPFGEITEDDIDAHIMTNAAGSPPLDILVRTSGVKRLSDYLLWQGCEDTQIQYTDGYWPEFGLWDFIPILLDYQRKAWSTPAHARDLS